MAADRLPSQRLARLIPLQDALTLIDTHVQPVAPHSIEVTAAGSRTLASDVAAVSSIPSQPIALRDGWAVISELTNDAGPYTPVFLSEPPPWCEAGEALPKGMDAIAPTETITVLNGQAQAIAPVSPGAGVLPTGIDADAYRPILRAGDTLNIADVATLAAMNIHSVQVRKPRIRLTTATPRPSDITAAATALLATAIVAHGGVVIGDTDHAGTNNLEAALRHEGADAVIAIGGTGRGRRDQSVEILGRTGRILFHGLGLMPGETSAFGLVGVRPILLVPGRLDAALASSFILGRKLLAKLTAKREDDVEIAGRLSRKIVSTVGIAQVVLVRNHGGSIEPLTGGEYWPLKTLLKAQGWFLIPAESEGYPAGTEIRMRLV